MGSDWVTVRIKRPEDYDDVAPEIVVEDFIQTARHGGWEYEIDEAGNTDGVTQ